ncbi:MAG: 3'(2'),5'-bisphosphate nucleotidase CysQ [Ignavibacteriales bacterium]|nr:3'(2'),5'-bisphosphate nucleotidase CysQ [Ignavibacteriales bacterium]
MNFDINKIIEIAKNAGDGIMSIYQTDSFEVEMKSDNSPLTRADKASHSVIAKGLSKLYPDIPILSEEGKSIPFETRKNWSHFWLVDPLDGTKEFIKKNDEFTVNIAFIKNAVPIAGVIYVPAQEVMYYGVVGKGAYKKIGEQAPVEITVSQNLEEGLIAVKSRSHSSEDEEKFFANYNIIDTISVGSSLKFCMVAEGKAQIYYRNGPTWEWDTGAGHAIVSASGGKVSGIGQDLNYNKESLLNSSFLVTAE